MKEIVNKALRGHGLKDICRDLNERGITNRGRRWQRASLHKLLVNEAFTSTAVWGKTNKGKKASDPVRVEGAWPAIVSRELFDAVGQAMRERAPAMRPPARVGSKFLLSGLLRCDICGGPFSIQSARSGKFSYYVCSKLMHEGAGACESRYLNAPKVEGFVVEKIKERILNNETITELVTLIA